MEIDNLGNCVMPPTTLNVNFVYNLPGQIAKAADKCMDAVGHVAANIRN